jgi:metal-responsive CopG/Arc/MetJ family transcriptional regulator
MKTAVSIPDPVFQSADALASRLGMSRSQLYATALAEYLAKHRDAKVTEQLNTVYAATATDPAVRTAARQTLDRSEW